MTIVVCHEMGHHLGGAPKYAGNPEAWSASEGGADYFSALKCVKNVFAKDDNVGIVAQMSVEPTVQKHCSELYANANESAICQRATTAAIVVAKILAELARDWVPGINHPDRHVVTETNTTTHPAAQCRLDTY